MSIKKEILELNDPENVIHKSVSGLGMPRPSILHQRINARICAIMNQDLNPEYEAIIEAEINGVNSKSPDICVWSLDNYGEIVEQKIVIETTTFYQRDNIQRKIFDLFRDYKTLKEAFMFIYDRNIWRRYTPKSEVYIESACSKFLEKEFKTTFDFSRPLKNAVFAAQLEKYK